ncbi:hypothetical protein [Streptomyces beijiangensis]|uniref:Uncharacterized protein n=1 Tax=Streptomyces beijiangensis TaxID=163361 RepID=A0A939F848_9ACTN|nr:hypothetical protein [Streptomyces beijiangensis]MBO0514356.1 hypothetical protein [Streptomyces beijiangensis]
MPLSTNLSLGLLEGTAVAVIGSLGRHRVDAKAEHILTEALNDGLRLGDVAKRLNEYGQGVGGEMSKVILLGDPAISFPNRSASSLRAVVSPKHVDGRGTPAPTAIDATTMVEVNHLSTQVLPALQRLRWMDIEVDQAALIQWDDAAIHLARVCLQPFHDDAPMAGELTSVLSDDVASAQINILKGIVENAHATWWRPGGPLLSECQPVASTAVPCPHCGRNSARSSIYRHRTREDLLVHLGICPRCGTWRWSSAAGGPVRHTTPMDIQARVGEAISLTAALHNDSNRTVRGAAAFVFVNGAYEHLPAPTVQAVTLAPGVSEPMTVTVRPDRRRVSVDLHEGMFLTLIDGAFSAYPLVVDLRPSRTG